MTKKKSSTVIIILIILALLLLLAVVFIFKGDKKKPIAAKPQTDNMEQSLVIDDGKDETEAENRESVFLKKGSSKQKRANAQALGGSETIKAGDITDTTGDRTETAEEKDIFLPGIW